MRTLHADIGKSPHVQSRKQAVAIALNTQREAIKKRAGGGRVSPGPVQSWYPPNDKWADPIDAPAPTGRTNLGPVYTQQDIERGRSMMTPEQHGLWSSGIADQTVNNRAKGGRTSPSDGAYLVGEKGPELFVPDKEGTIKNAEQTKKIVRSLRNGQVSDRARERMRGGGGEDEDRIDAASR
jgi:hypothetical protein